MALEPIEGSGTSLGRFPTTPFACHPLFLANSHKFLVNVVVQSKNPRNLILSQKLEWLLKKKKKKRTSVDKDEEKLEPSSVAGRDVKLQLLCRTLWQLLR